MLKPQLPSAVNYLYIFSAFIKSKPWRETCDDTFLNGELQFDSIEMKYHCLIFCFYLKQCSQLHVLFNVNMIPSFLCKSVFLLLIFLDNFPSFTNNYYYNFYKIYTQKSWKALSFVLCHWWNPLNTIRSVFLNNLNTELRQL